MTDYQDFYRSCMRTSMEAATKVLQYHKRGVPMDKIKDAILADEAKEKDEKEKANNTLSCTNTSFLWVDYTRTGTNNYFTEKADIG